MDFKQANIKVTNFTHIDLVRNENKTIRETIQKLLGWTSMEYAKFQEQMGLAYLKEEFEGCADYVALVSKEKIFWSWWINHWVNRDKLFLMEANSLNESWRQRIYKGRNNPESHWFKLSKAMMQQSYGVMIGKLIKSKHND